MKRSGQMIVELLMVIGLSAITLPALLTGFVVSREGRPQQTQRLAAVAFLKETKEAVRVVRESDWANISTDIVMGNEYHPVLSGSTWTLAAGNETVNGLTRSVVISDVYRDANGAIVTSGGTLDPSTKKAVSTVSWTQPFSSSISATSFFTRFLDNAAYIQTTESDFNTGSRLNVSVTNVSGGEIQMASNTKGQWCDPTLSSATIDLPATPKAVWAEPGHAYVASGTSQQASTVSFTRVDIADTDPPSGTIHGSFNGYIANDVWADTNYGFVATTHDSKEVVIIDLNSYADPVNKKYAEVGYFNTPSSSTNAQSLFVLQDRGYVTTNNYLYVFNLSSKSGSRAQIGSRINFANSGDTAGEIYGVEIGTSKYIFVGIEGSTVEELKIINVTNHSGGSSQWGVVGSINIEPNNCSSLESGKSVYIKPDGTRAYLGSSNDASFKEFFVLDTSNKSSPSLVGGIASNPPCTNGGGYDSGGMDPEQSVVVSLAENRAILVGIDAAGGADSEEYQVLDMSNEGSPSKCGGLQINQGVYGVAAVKEGDGDAYAYLITGDSSNDLKIVQGGPDGAYNEEGTYESAIFDPGYSATFNRFTATATVPAQTSLQLQIAVADPVAGSCSNSTYDYVGPDGTANTYYTPDEDTIIINNDGATYENPAQCFRYKAYFTSLNPNATAVLSDITVNYSP